MQAFLSNLPEPLITKKLSGSRSVHNYAASNDYTEKSTKYIQELGAEIAAEADISSRREFDATKHNQNLQSSSIERVHNVLAGLQLKRNFRSYKRSAQLDASKEVPKNPVINPVSARCTIDWHLLC